MTFYSILFGLLLVETTKELFCFAFATPDDKFSWCDIGMALTLALAMSSSVLFTVHVIEEWKKPYPHSAKLVDWISFFVVAIALLALDPSGSNFLHADVVRGADRANQLLVFWGCLLVYSMLVCGWNIIVVPELEQGFRFVGRVVILLLPLVAYALALSPCLTHSWRYIENWPCVLAWSTAIVVLAQIIFRFMDFKKIDQKLAIDARDAKTTVDDTTKALLRLAAGSKSGTNPKELNSDLAFPMASEMDFVSHGVISKYFCVMFEPLNTNYRLQLVFKPLCTIASNQLVQGRIRAKAREVHTVSSGGGFIQPLCGSPRIVQGRVLHINHDWIIIDAGIPVMIELPGKDDEIHLNRGEITKGCFVNAVCYDGAIIEHVVVR